MDAKRREIAVKLRIEKEMSYSEIKDRLGVPKSTLSYWLRDLPLSKSRIKYLQDISYKKGEVSREKYRETMRLKRKLLENEVYEKYMVRFNKISEDSLLIAGLVLYLSEGDKKNNTRIVLANTDFKIIKFFQKWLIRFLNVNTEEFRVQLHLYEGMDLEKERKIWQDVLELPVNQFYKLSVRKLRESSFSYADSFGHGTCSLYVLGVERKRQLTAAIQAFIDQSLKL